LEPDRIRSQQVISTAKSATSTKATFLVAADFGLEIGEGETA
jgi:hypothetical protein